MVNYPKEYYYFYYNHSHNDELGKLEPKSNGGKNNNNMREKLKLIKRAHNKSKLLFFLCISLLSCSLILMFQISGFLFCLSYFLVDDSLQGDKLAYNNEVGLLHEKVGLNPPILSPVSNSNGTLDCDRSHFRTDICLMKGDIRTHFSSHSILLYTSTNPKSSLEFPPGLLHENIEEQELQHEIIKPYTRKWETSIMKTIDQLHLISKYKPLNSHHNCDIVHDVPAIFFSTGGYTGNFYHEFNDGIIPLYITSHHLNKKVIFVILEYHNWWYTKYGQILSQLSNYPPIDFNVDTRTHCFKEAIVGLKIHNELTIDSTLMQENKSVLDFQNLLSRAFQPSSPSTRGTQKRRPKIVILSRKGSRSITNEHSLIKLARKIGFHVQVLRPNRNTELGSIYRTLSTSDVMIGVHGAAMTHFLFLKPGSLLVQIIPLGTEWASETYYGEPAKKYGLKYIGYNIHPKESSLYKKYDKNDPVLRDPSSVNKQGWEFTKRIYLDDQYVTLDLKRFRKLLVSAYGDYSFKPRN